MYSDYIFFFFCEFKQKVAPGLWGLSFKTVLWSLFYWFAEPILHIVTRNANYVLPFSIGLKKGGVH